MAIKGGINRDYKDNLTGTSYMFAGLNNMIDPYNLPIDKGWMPKAENVDIDNTNSISRRDGFSSIISTTTAHSGWSNGTTALYVDGSFLKSFNGASATTIDVVTPNLKMYYVNVNDVVLYSNGIESGFIGGENKQAGTYSSYFKETTIFGICLEFYNGRVYHAKENSVYCTDMFDVENTDIRQKNVATFKSKVTMIRRVVDGLYIGTEKQTHFLRGNDLVEGGFDLVWLADYGVVLGTDVSTEAEYFPSSKATGMIVVWTSKRGICTGGASGNFINHSINIVSLPEAYSGAGLLKDANGFKQYIATLGTTDIAYNSYEPIDSAEINTI